MNATRPTSLRAGRDEDEDKTTAGDERRPAVARATEAERRRPRTTDPQRGRLFRPFIHDHQTCLVAMPYERDENGSSSCQINTEFLLNMSPPIGFRMTLEMVDNSRIGAASAALHFYVRSVGAYLTVFDG
jgi:hypothetical protein